MRLVAKGPVVVENNALVCGGSQTFHELFEGGSPLVQPILRNETSYGRAALPFDGGRLAGGNCGDRHHVVPEGPQMVNFSPECGHPRVSGVDAAGLPSTARDQKNLSERSETGGHSLERGD